MPQRIVAQTERLVVRWLETDDAPFIVDLLNQPSWLRYIGDRGVKTLDDARRYLLEGPIEMYRRVGFGLYLLEQRDTREPVGMCGLIKRDTLDDVDLGFALLPQFWGQGYAFEAADAVLAYGRGAVGLQRIVAICTPDNESSVKLLERLGFRFEQMVR